MCLMYYVSGTRIKEGGEGERERERERACRKISGSRSIKEKYSIMPIRKEKDKF